MNRRVELVEIPSIEALRDLVEAADLYDAASVQLARALTRCRDQGWPWPDIADALDVDKDTAARLYERVRTILRVDVEPRHPARRCAL